MAAFLLHETQDLPDGRLKSLPVLKDPALCVLAEDGGRGGAFAHYAPQRTHTARTRSTACHLSLHLARAHLTACLCAADGHGGSRGSCNTGSPSSCGGAGGVERRWHQADGRRRRGGGVGAWQLAGVADGHIKQSSGGWVRGRRRGQASGVS
jgi:hypothetical protein